MTPLLDIQGLRASFFTRRGEVRVLDSVSLTIQRGEVVGLVGESGSGKSVTATAILRLLRHPGRIVGGRIVLDGVDLVALDEPAMQEVRGRKVAMIFQSPRACLDPVVRVGRQLLTVLKERRGVIGAEGRRAARELLNQVRLPEPDRVMAAYPHELSGGMCQRVMIASALACRPQLLLADEPTTGLDVTIQREIIELLHDLTTTTGMAQLLISHDMGVVGEACDVVAVMYAGQIVEMARKSALFGAPQHPYTIGLLACRTRLDADGPLSAIPGTIPDLLERPSGCPFAPRCDRAGGVCRDVRPPLASAGEGHAVACHFPGPA